MIEVFDSVGFDTDTKLTAADVAAAVKMGFVWCARYISLGAEAPGDLDAEEVKIITGGGLRLFVVQHVLREGWVPSANLGQRQGEAALENMESIGYDEGAHSWFDDEGVAPGTPAQAVIDHFQAAAEVVAPRNRAGLYDGAACGLNAQQLYLLKGINSYWRAPGLVPEIAVRGHAIRQFYPEILIGSVVADLDVLSADLKGERPIWMERT